MKKKKPSKLHRLEHSQCRFNSTAVKIEIFRSRNVANPILHSPWLSGFPHLKIDQAPLCLLRSLSYEDERTANSSGKVLLGILGGGVLPGSLNPDPLSYPKNVILHTHFQTRPLKSIPIFRHVKGVPFANRRYTEGVIIIIINTFLYGAFTKLNVPCNDLQTEDKIKIPV